MQLDDDSYIIGKVSLWFGKTHVLLQDQDPVTATAFARL